LKLYTLLSQKPLLSSKLQVGFSPKCILGLAPL
jgi:hypothetical protein